MAKDKRFDFCGPSNSLPFEIQTHKGRFNKMKKWVLVTEKGINLVIEKG